MPITTKVVSSNHVHDEVYSIQYYVIKFVSDLQQVGGFSPGALVSSNKTDCHNITEILLKVALNTTTLTFISVERPSYYYFNSCFEMLSLKYFFAIWKIKHATSPYFEFEETKLYLINLCQWKLFLSRKLLNVNGRCWYRAGMLGMCTSPQKFGKHKCYASLNLSEY